MRLLESDDATEILVLRRMLIVAENRWMAMQKFKAVSIASAVSKLFG